MDMSLSKVWEIVKDRGDWCAVVHGVAEGQMTEQEEKGMTEDEMVGWHHR